MRELSPNDWRHKYRDVEPQESVKVNDVIWYRLCSSDTCSPAKLGIVKQVVQSDDPQDPTVSFIIVNSIGLAYNEGKEPILPSQVLKVRRFELDHGE